MILAAGSGTRLRPLTDRLPKCMVPLAGKPLLEHTITRLPDYGVTELIINLCFMPEAVIDYFGDGHRWGVHIRYSLEAEALGTAGGVKKVADYFDEPFLVWYGDNLSTCNVNQLSRQHRVKGGIATVAVHSREDVTQSGIVELDSEDRIIRLVEKPRTDEVFSHWANAGIYVLDPSALEYVPGSAASDFARDIFPTMLKGGERLYGYQLKATERLWWIDRPEDLERVRSEMEAPA
jgi:mannose-1-phosphate guanylyltransferase